MLANPAIQAPRAVFTGRTVVATDLPSAEGVASRPQPAAPWARGHLSFRGTRIFTSLMLGWAGLIVLALGAFVVPAAREMGRGEIDPGLMALLNGASWWLVGLGIANVVAAGGILRDRSWALRSAMWLLAIGTLVVTTGLVFTFAGRDPFALTDPAATANGVGLLMWALALYGLVGWGLRRVLTARQQI